MKIKIVSPGLLSTVQDLGRPDWRSSGVPLGGAVDTTSHRLANFLVGNEKDAATLEIAGGSFAAQVQRAGWLAVCGSGGQWSVDKKAMDFGRLLFMPSGTTLEINPGPGSNYTYLAVPGGWDVPEVLGSKSTCLSAGFGGFEGRSLQNGDMLKSQDKINLTGQFLPDNLWASPWFVGDLVFRNLSTFGKPGSVIRVLSGPESNWWSAAQQEQFFKISFVISMQRDRMGVRLENSSSLRSPKERIMLSTAVSPGAVQVPPGGQPIILLADAQTTGGYPRIAQVIAVDIPRLAQIPTGQTIYFQKVTLEEAERLFFEQENLLQKIQLALRWKLNSYLS